MTSIQGRDYPAWLFPRKDNNCAEWRFLFATLSNAFLLAYALPRWEHLNDIRDWLYVQLDLGFDFVLGSAPLSIFLILMPLMLSDNKLFRTAAVLLAAFPGYLALVVWYQLLDWFPWQR